MSLLQTPDKSAGKVPVITNLKNHVLIATEQLKDSPFDRGVIYICNHTDDGAMGVMINHPIRDVTFQNILDDMGIDGEPISVEPTIYSGGPVEPNRGFVLHGSDYDHDSTLKLDSDIRLSATADIVDAIAHGKGPRRINFCLGYAGWNAGQLEEEIATDSWLVTPADSHILFDIPAEDRYEACVSGMGITLANYAGFVGEA